MSLIEFGFSAARAETFRREHPDLEPGRVVRQDRQYLRIHTDAGEVLAAPSGRLKSGAADAEGLPVIGDWVAITTGSKDDVRHLAHVLPRTSLLSRREVGDSDRPQPMAANIDWVLVVLGLDTPVNVRRLERSLTWVWNCGATPLVLLNKADLCLDVPAALAEIETAAAGVEVFVGSALTGDGVDAVRARLIPGQTSLLLGASGAGKSTWVNALIGDDAQATGGVRAFDQKGRHTTSHRELRRLANGSLLVDIPGVRELGLWVGESDGLAEAFADVEALAQQCRFADCTHVAEPGCAVRGAVPADRLESYLKLQRELARLAALTDVRAAQARKKKEREQTNAGYAQTRAKRRSD